MAKIEVNVDALLHNVEKLKALTESNQFNTHANTHLNTELMAVIKANAYGHGYTKVAAFLDQKVDYFAVARLEEAIQLKKSGIKTSILILDGFFSVEEISQLVEYKIETVIHHESQIKWLQEWQQQHRLKSAIITVWVKVDTGMHRLGFDPEQIPAVFSALKALPCVRKPLHLLSHFANSDQPEHPLNAKQIAVFKQVIASLPEKDIDKKSLSASAGIFGLPNAHFDVIRAGIVLYGISPFSGKTGQDLGLRPIMTLKSKVIALKKIKKGESIGYGSIWTSEQDTQIAVIAMGYGDGYPRDTAQQTAVLLNGRQVPIVGRISMDMLVVDIGNQALDKIGDEVIFWGEALPIELIAERSHLSAYEIVTRLTGRLSIDYVYDNYLLDRDVVDHDIVDNGIVGNDIASNKITDKSMHHKESI